MLDDGFLVASVLREASSKLWSAFSRGANIQRVRATKFLASELVHEEIFDAVSAGGW